MNDDLRDLMLATTEEMLSAQLRAVRALRTKRSAAPPNKRRSMSQVDMAYAILQEAGQALHVSQIIQRATERFEASLDRESLVSSLTKRVARHDRFERVGPNRFALRREG
jgi:hypothetical protein